MEIVYTSDPRFFPIFHVQRRRAGGAWEFVEWVTRPGEVITFRHGDAERFARERADVEAWKGFQARVVKRSPDEPLSAAQELDN